jgi:hypothetical protein
MLATAKKIACAAFVADSGKQRSADLKDASACFLYHTMAILARAKVGQENHDAIDAIGSVGTFNGRVHQSDGCRCIRCDGRAVKTACRGSTHQAIKSCATQRIRNAGLWRRPDLQTFYWQQYRRVHAERGLCFVFGRPTGLLRALRLWLHYCTGQRDLYCERQLGDRQAG